MTQHDNSPVEDFDGLSFMPALSDSAQHVTIYKGDRPVGTLARRRVYDRTGPVWTIYATDGTLLRKVQYVPGSYATLARIARNAVRER